MCVVAAGLVAAGFAAAGVEEAGVEEAGVEEAGVEEAGVVQVGDGGGEPLQRCSDAARGRFCVDRVMDRVVDGVPVCSQRVPCANARP